MDDVYCIVYTSESILIESNTVNIRLNVYTFHVIASVKCRKFIVIQYSLSMQLRQQQNTLNWKEIGLVFLINHFMLNSNFICYFKMIALKQQLESFYQIDHRLECSIYLL